MSERTFGELIDLSTIIFCCIILVNITVILFAESQGSLVGKEDDKTAVTVIGAISSQDVERTGADLLMSLIILDAYSPYPKSIRINNSPIIDLDSNWLLAKFYNITMIYSVDGAYKLGTMLDWRIVSTVYEPNNGDPYIQYRLEE